MYIALKLKITKICGAKPLLQVLSVTKHILQSVNSVQKLECKNNLENNVTSISDNFQVK